MKRSEWEDKVPGGLADKRKPSDFDPKALAKGRKVEMEHTKDPHLAQEIAMDHLTEDPDYYDKLEKLEKESRAKSVEKLAAAVMVREAALRLAAARQATFWLNVEGVRNLTVKDYEAPDRGNSGISGLFFLKGTLHIQPKGAVWSATYPVNHKVTVSEHPESGTYAFSPEGKDPTARLLGMALLEYDVENAVRKALGKLEFVPYEPVQKVDPAKQAWAWLEAGLRKQKLPTEKGALRQADAGEFMLAAPQPFPVRGMRGGPFWQFKHGDTRNYVLIEDGTGKMVVPQTSQPWFRGTFDKFAAYGDPYWLTAKYPGKAQDGTPVKKGDKVLYWPRTKTMMVGPKADQAWREFQSQAADEDFYNRAATDRTAEIVSPPAVIVGDIFYSSWGYDQTNVDYYQVIKTSPAMIVIREVKKKVTRGQGKPVEFVIPLANQFVGPALRKKLLAYNGRAMVNLNSYSRAYKWDGQEKGQTGFGFGR